MLDKAKGIKYDLCLLMMVLEMAARLLPSICEVELGVLCCPGGLRVGPSPFPGWGCGLSIGKACGCLSQGMGSTPPSPVTVQEEVAKQILHWADRKSVV